MELVLNVSISKESELSYFKTVKRSKGNKPEREKRGTERGETEERGREERERRKGEERRESREEKEIEEREKVEE
jgi:hypothetical protein